MGSFILEPQRQLNVDSSCDVLVAGGGIAGIAAAMAAARAGKKVTLVEREYALGGMATLGLVTIYLPLCDGEGNQLIYGIAEELLKLSIKHVVEANYPKAWIEGGSLEERLKGRYITQFNAHLFALSAEELLLDLGVTILYGTLIASVVKEGDFISHVIVENKSGRSAIAVDSVIDATGDADICEMAGAKTALHGRGNILASWYYYFMQGKVSLKMFGLADLPPNLVPLPKKGNDPYKADKVAKLDENLRFSGVDGVELSNAVIEAHKKMYEDILKFREEDDTYVPVTISTIPLVRMSRRLCGAYTMDESEERKFFPDSIGLTGDWRKKGPAFEIPFGTLYGHEVKNLLAAGRDISVTDAMWDITRVIPPCAVTGEAAGIAAAMGNDFTKTDIKELQERLVANGVKLHVSDIYK
ncbi:MAG: FAD-dependent oxidoreductase [Oscillospiraceae bacterium]|nr:FAD-dependent oxidoreductase [Oscillospiraceae bacterium]